jgi:hypothetical protein
MSALVLIAGCGGTSLLTGTESTNTQATTSSGYLAALSAEQAKLASAERGIPRRPRTPAALAHAIALLHSAIQRLALDLAAIHPPASVTHLHERLVRLASSYASRLAHAARVAGRPGGELEAANELTAATNQAIRAFTTTTARIDQILAG